ncbi:photosystem II assembly protein Psb35 [Almyronema epifaneia]|uniref:Photosystem II assembly protein Psb35 n=1 Tax=Almyronema epifaneia S1 TaxID=2991925 RepID=A0ABW6IIZ2_9CYAN
MNLFMQTAESTALPISLGMVFFIGFVAAVVLGSIAWYNSKRPTGWEDKERPDVVPKIDK